MICFIRKPFCMIGYHYHDEKDGLYISGLSYGRCQCCGIYIRKNKNGNWIEVAASKGKK